MEISDIKAEDEYKGVRIKFNAYIERARIRLQFDIGFGDSVYPRAVFAEYPVLLGGDWNGQQPAERLLRHLGA